MIDVVIPLCTGSIYDDLELRYCLRAIQQNLLGYNRIYIIGHLPDWCKNVVHIPMDDKNKYKQKNILKKILRACDESSVSDDFIFFNDDHYLTRQVFADDYPNYITGSIESEIVRCKGEYKNALINTLSVLTDISHWNYDCHYPILYNKKRFKDVMSMYDWSGPDGYVIKSLYGNTLNLSPTPTPDCKVHDAISQDKLDDLIETRSCLSTSNYAMTNIMKRTLERLFPEKSVYER